MQKKRRGQLNGQTDAKPDRRMDREKNRCTGKQRKREISYIQEHTYIHTWVNRIYRNTDGQRYTDRHMGRQDKQEHEYMG